MKMLRLMRAAVVTGPGRLTVHRVDIPEPGEGELRIRLEGCGVCASSLGPWAGPAWQTFPLAPGELGHEGWGVVDAVGPGVDDTLVGRRVATLSCRSFAEMDIAVLDEVIFLPEALNGKSFPGEPLGCAINIFARSDIRTGQHVAIVGIGFLGAVLTKLASCVGANVIAISRREESLQLAREMGANVTLAMNDPGGIIHEVRELSGGELCQRVIECVGKQAPLDLAGELVAPGGKLIVAGYHQDGPRSVDMQAWNWRGIDVVNAHERDLARRRLGVEQAVGMVAAGMLHPATFLTHSYPLEQLDAALDATRDKPAGFVKAVIRF